MKNDINNDIKNEAQKSPERLEREIDETRADISDTVDALARKFSPGELLDRSLGLVKEHGGDVAINLRDSIKEKPLAALLTGVGLAWLMAPTSPHRSRQWTGESRGYSASDYSASYGTTHDASETWGSNETGSKMTRARQHLSSTGDRLKDVVTGARDRLSGAGTSVGDSVGQTTASAKAQATIARDRFISMKEQEPLILGVLGLAVGALVGAALPRSETEDRLIGNASDATKGELKDRGQQLYSEAKEKAEKAGEAATRAVSDREPSNQTVSDRQPSNHFE